MSNTQNSYNKSTDSASREPVNEITTYTLAGSGQTNVQPNSIKQLPTDRLSINKLTLSAAGKAFIKGWEGSKISVDGTKSFYYDDSANYCTVGWGHLVAGKASCASKGLRGMKYSHTPIEGDEKKYDWILINEAQHKFDNDTFNKAVCIVKKDIKVPLFQWEFDAICALAFNAGRPSIVAPKLIKLVNSGDYTNAPKQMLDINKAGGVVQPGLVLRRKSEYNVFTKNIYNSRH